MKNNHKIIMVGAPYCPLCDKRMREIFTRKGMVYSCTEIDCMVSIRAKDPAITRWRTVDAMRCQFCSKPMRMFFRSDGFLKAWCKDESHHPYCIMRGDPKYMGEV
jgi:hypothetical protein